MIPKVIHYCWFGNNDKPELVEKCIESWHKYFLEYEFMEWNENNVDLDSEILYVRQAYSEKKYAFVSDYIRLKKLVEYGGIYFDTDYEVIKPIGELLGKGILITGFESHKSILTAMIAAEQNNSVLASFLESYENRQFITADGQLDTTPINVYFSKLLEKHGVNLEVNQYQIVNDSIVIYPMEVLCGFDVDNWHEKISSNTYGIHHMGMSWSSPEMRKHIKMIHFWQKVLGIKLYDQIKAFINNMDKAHEQ